MRPLCLTVFLNNVYKSSLSDSQPLSGQPGVGINTQCANNEIISEVDLANELQIRGK
jgi:hypothetical protein